MQLLKRQFGKHFVDLLNKSPSLTADIKEMRKRGIRVRRSSRLAEAYACCNTKIITIGKKNASTVYQLINLAHELEHLLRGLVKGNDHKKLSLKRFVQRSLREETNCYVRECQIMDELIAAGVKIPDFLLKRYQKYYRGGWQGIRKKVLKDQVCFEANTTYPQLFAQQYDEMSMMK